MKPDVIIIGAGIGKTALTTACQIAAIKNTAVLVVSPAEAKQNAFEPEPIPFSAAPRYVDQPIFLEDKKNYITGKDIPRKNAKNENTINTSTLGLTNSKWL